MTVTRMPARLAAVVRNTATRSIRRHSRVFSGYEDALRGCRDGGYNSVDITAVVRAKTARMVGDPEFCEYALPAAGRAGIALASVIANLLGSTAGTVRVLDFGGACGAHYFVACRVAPTLRFEWCVVETEAMIEHARTLESGGLRFAASVASAQSMLGSIDLVHSSSTLQYLPDPEFGLAELIGVGAPAMALTRLSLTDGEPFTIVQKSRLAHNGPGPLPTGFRDCTVAYPLTILNRARFEAALCREYEIAACYRDESSDHVTPRGDIHGSSYLCLRKGAVYP
jgi:putative methyltransferase (TIGR04325 family)